MSPEGQHKVCFRVENCQYDNPDMPKLLSANLEEADPTVYGILQRVCYPPIDDRFPPWKPEIFIDV